MQTLRPHPPSRSDKVTIDIILPARLNVTNGSVRSSLLSVPAAGQAVRGAPSVSTCQNQVLSRLQTILSSSSPSPSSSHHRSQPFHHSYGQLFIIALCSLHPPHLVLVRHLLIHCRQTPHQWLHLRLSPATRPFLNAPEASLMLTSTIHPRRVSPRPPLLSTPCSSCSAW